MLRRSLEWMVGLSLSFVLAACGTNPASSQTDEPEASVSIAPATSPPGPQPSEVVSSTAAPVQTSRTAPAPSALPTTVPATTPPSPATVTKPATAPFTKPSTVYGFVTAGPTCPVERVDQPCPPQPLRTTVQARSIGGSTSGSATTDESGRYEMSLPPGRYTLEAQSGSIFPRCEPVEVMVTASAATRADIDCDTGIRN